MLKYITTVLLFVITLQGGTAKCQQQSIKITVVDDKGTPVPKATLTNKTQNYSLVCDDKGKLLLNKPLDKADELWVTSIGYGTQKIDAADIYGKQEAHIVLNDRQTDLSEVKVKADDKEKLSFKNIAALPFPLFYNGLTTDGHYMYSVAGQSGTAMCTQALKYDPATNNWSLLAHNLKPTVQASANYVPSTGKIYVIGGVTSLINFTYFDGVETIDVKTGKVELLKVKNPAPKSYSGSVVWDNKIYIFGGGNDINSVTISSGQKTFYVFDPATQTFSRLPDMPEKLQTSGAVIDGVIYAIGGYNPQNGTIANKTIYTYDIAAGSWKAAGKLPVEVSANGIAVSGHLIFVVGGYSHQDLVGVYNTHTNEFRKLSSNMTDRKHNGAVIIDDKLLVAGGSNIVSTRDYKIDVGISSTQQADLHDVLLKEQ